MIDWSVDPVGRMRYEQDRRTWKKFCSAWSMIALAESQTHNLMVLVHAPTEEQRLAGAREVANTIVGVLIVAMEALEP